MDNVNNDSKFEFVYHKPQENIPSWNMKRKMYVVVQISEKLSIFNYQLLINL